MLGWRNWIAAVPTKGRASLEGTGENPLQVRILPPTPTQPKVGYKGTLNDLAIR